MCVRTVLMIIVHHTKPGWQRNWFMIFFSHKCYKNAWPQQTYQQCQSQNNCEPANIFFHMFLSFSIFFILFRSFLAVILYCHKTFRFDTYFMGKSMLCLHISSTSTPNHSLQYYGGFMKNVQLHKLLLLVTLISWISFLVFLFLVYLKSSFILEMFLSFLTACVSTTMLSRFRSGNY